MNNENWLNSIKLLIPGFLLRVRTRMKLSGRQFGKAVKLSGVTVSKWERGEAIPTRDNWLKIIDLMEVKNLPKNMVGQATTFLMILQSNFKDIHKINLQSVFLKSLDYRILSKCFRQFQTDKNINKDSSQEARS